MSPANGRAHHVTRRGFLGAFGVAALAGCSASVAAADRPAPVRPRRGEYTGPAVTLQFWNPFTGGDGPAMAEIVEAFNAAHDNIRVVMTSLVADDLYAKVMPAVGAGEGPDVAIMHLDQLATFAARGTIAPLEELTDGLGLDGTDFIPAVWDSGVYEGHRYGIPLDVFTMAQYWATDTFGAAGLEGPVRDRGHFDAAASSLRNAGVTHPFWVTPSWQLFVTLLAQFGGSLYDEAATAATMGSDAGVAALEWMTSLIEAGVSPSGATDPRLPFKNGGAAMLADLPAAIPDLQLTAPDLAWDVAPFPQIGTRPGTFANSHNFVLTGQSQADDDVAHAAQTFVEWTSRNSEPWIASGNTPARATVRAGEAFAAAPQAALAKPEVFSSAAFLPQIPGSREIAANSYERAVSEVVLSGADAAEALDFAQHTAQEQLEEMHELLDG
ncbi:MAG TPA: extracellular solute-binding protein [Micromonosporaceae bacterium]|nr:extracellular solute-binding protein [Micromonosporaceae bacterium]